MSRKSEPQVRFLVFQSQQPHLIGIDQEPAGADLVNSFLP